MTLSGSVRGAGPRRSMSGRVMTAAWLTGACVMLAVIIRTWVLLPFPRPFRPVLPYQYTPITDMRYWLFLDRAAACVAEGASFTIVGTSPGQEHELYVFSVGLIPHAKPLASTYFGFRHPENVASARFIVAFGGAEPPAGAREVCRNDFGAVFERGGR